MLKNFATEESIDVEEADKLFEHIDQKLMDRHKFPLNHSLGANATDGEGFRERKYLKEEQYARQTIVNTFITEMPHHDVDTIIKTLKDFFREELDIEF
jgi:hypothetical protein